MVEPLVIPFVVVVRDELADGATPRARADQDHALEAGFFDGAHDALRVGVQVRRAGGASDGGDSGRGERVAPGRPEARVAVMDEDPDVSQESVLGIGGVPHELGDPRPVGLGADARDLTAAAGPVNQDQPGEAGQAAWRPDGIDAPICQDTRSGRQVCGLARSVVCHHALKDLAGEKAFETADDLPFGPPFSGASFDVVEGW